MAGLWRAGLVSAGQQRRRAIVWVRRGAGLPSVLEANTLSTPLGLNCDCLVTVVPHFVGAPPTPVLLLILSVFPVPIPLGGLPARVACIIGLASSRVCTTENDIKLFANILQIVSEVFADSKLFDKITYYLSQ